MIQFNINMTPDSHLVRSVANTRITTPEAVSEMVDNSFDAGATNVLISLLADSIKVEDDGRGCSDLESMLTFGKHRRQSSTKLGRFGVGLKNAACGLGESLSIETIHRGTKRSAEVNWNDVEEQGWYSVAGYAHDGNFSKSGTVIEVSALRKKPSALPLIKELEFLFAPALWTGRTIRVNGTEVVAWFPKIKGHEIVAEEEHDVLSISFSVRAGLTDLNDKDPFILSYEHRILGGTTEPCGKYITSSRFVALVELKGKWELLKHKDGLKEGPKSAWLYERLHDLCGELLSKLHKVNESLELSCMSAELSEALEDITGSPTRPNEGDDSGSHSPRGTDRKVEEAEQIRDRGPVRKRKRRGCDIVYGPLEDNLLGKVDVNGQRVCIQLNERHPYIIESRLRKDANCLKACAAFLLCYHQATTTDEKQMLIRFEEENQKAKFISIVSRVFLCMAKTPKRIVK